MPHESKTPTSFSYVDRKANDVKLKSKLSSEVDDNMNRIKNEIKQLNTLTQNNAKVNLYNRNESTEAELREKQVLAKYIHDNHAHLTPEEIKNIVVNQIMTARKFERELLSFEYDYYQPDIKCESKDVLINEAQKLLSRYSTRLGVPLEDSEWTVYNFKNCSTTEYDIPQNEIWLENTTSTMNGDSEVLEFLENMTEKLKLLNTNVNVTYEMKQHRNAYVSLIKCIFPKKKKHNKKHNKA